MICTVWHSRSYDVSVCNSFHPVLALQSFGAAVFNVLSWHTHQTHKGVQFTFIWRLSVDISSAIMLGCRVMLLPLVRTSQHQEKPPCPSSSPCFHPRQLAAVLWAVSLAFLFSYFTRPPPPLPYFLCEEQTCLYEDVNLKKKIIFLLASPL